MKPLGSYLLAILAGFGAALVIPFSGVLIIPLLLLYHGLGLPSNGDFATRLVAIPPALVFLGIGLALSNERWPSTWRWAVLLAIGMILGGLFGAWAMTDDVQAGIQMDAAWVRVEWLDCLRGAFVWVVGPGIAALLFGTWYGSSIARRRWGTQG